MNKNPKKYCVNIPEIDKEIEELAQRYCGDKKEEFFRQLFTSIVKLHMDKAAEEDLHLMNIAIKELRHAFRVFMPYRGIRKAVIFGSHRTPENDPEYKMTEEFARKMVRHGYMVITGGGGGIMEAGNKGAGQNGFAAKIRINIESPNPYIPKGERLITFNYFFDRKLIFIKESDATVLFPGGFGTLDEGFEALTLVQTGKCPPRPIILIDDPKTKYWKNWLKFVKDNLVKNDFLKKIDLNLFTITNDIDEAVAEITGFYKVYHSIRFINDLTVIRMEKQIPPAAYKKLSQEFRDILVKGAIEPCEAQSAEKNNKEYPHLPRLKMYFDQKSFSRLLTLIKKINRYA